jgi:tetratricopeptide (TPR) repeat protein
VNDVSLSAASVEALVGQVADEFTQRLNRGERPDVEEHARRHPEIAGLLREVLPALQLLRAPEVGLAATAEAAGHGGTLGDFRLLREVGRGGMGIVYEAEQLSLGRRVALKVLPFAATLDVKQLLRFKNEALAASTLRHAHIVPVYAVGCDRGVHHYAMQFIDGQSLAEAIAALRDPTAGARTALAAERAAGGPGYFRSVARLGLQAAEALEHAHQLGVVHRDVKPANLLLDDAGRLWVTDFGLARFAAGENLTLTGDLVGTLRYMSPEQALAKKAQVDARSDVYSLGATLYEALTLEPAYPGGDREELLQQIVRGEFKPPRRIDPSIPVALETVILQAMAREPDRRYASAREFADDLGRFLDGQPVRAVRPTWLERSAGWAQRHRPAVAAAVAGLLLALAGLSASTVVFWHQRKQTEAALEQAREQEKETRRQQQRAEANFHKALAGATRILAQLDPQPAGGLLDGDRLRQALLDQGVGFFREFIDEDNPDPAVRFETGRAYRLMATVYCARQEVAQAQATMRKAFAVLGRLVEAYPREPAYRRELIGTHYLMGLLYTSLKQPREARAEYDRTAELYRLALAHDESAATANNYAMFLADCPDVALRDPGRAVALAELAVERDPEESACWNTLGIARYRAGEWAAAVAALERSMSLGGGDAHDWYFLALAHARLGHKDKARAWQAKAVRWADSRPAQREDLMRYRAEAAALLGD